MVTDFFLEWLVGAIVWTFANVLYVDLRRKGARRGRVVSFIAGYPGTLIAYFAVREGQAARIDPPGEDEDRLLREIRMDRELRRGEGGRRDGVAEVQDGDGEPEGPPST